MKHMPQAMTVEREATAHDKFQLQAEILEDAEKQAIQGLEAIKPKDMDRMRVTSGPIFQEMLNLGELAEVCPDAMIRRRERWVRDHHLHGKPVIDKDSSGKEVGRHFEFFNEKEVQVDLPDYLFYAPRHIMARIKTLSSEMAAKRAEEFVNKIYETGMSPQPVHPGTTVRPTEDETDV